MNYQANYQGLKSEFDVDLVDGYVRVQWTLRELGGPFPGGDWLVKDPRIEFRAPGHEPVRHELIVVGHPDKTIVGLNSFRRMREIMMPSEPWSYAVSVPPGKYQVCFTAELYDCRCLTHYCDAMQIFAGNFGEMVKSFEEHRQLWFKRGHAEAGEPYRFPCELVLGELTVPEGHANAPLYFPVNDLSRRVLPWEPAPQRKVVPPPPTPLQPETYFRDAIASGVQSMRTYGFCRWGTHCNEKPAPAGSHYMGGSDRLYSMWGSTFSLHYMLTGDAETGAGAWYCVRDCLDMAQQRESKPHQKHCLSFGMVSMMMVRFARAMGRPDWIEPLAVIWRQWPYDEARHTMATQPSVDGGDLTPNDTYNMRMVGATAMWLVGKYLNDQDLMRKGKDCVLNSILPALRPEGYWCYRPNSPEGKIVNGIPSSNHYDGFVKQLLARLLFHPEWRQEKAAMSALQRGVDYALKNLVVQDARTLRYELYPDAHFPPRESLAKYLGHAGMYAEPLSLLALYADPSYLDPLRKSVQFAYDHRDDPVFTDYWDNSWLYGCYVGLMNLSRLGFRFGGSPDRLTLQPPDHPDPFL